MILATLTRFLGAPVEFDTLVAVLAGWTAGATAIVLVGRPLPPSYRRVDRGRTGRRRRAAGQVEQAGLDARGSTPYFGTGATARSSS